MAHNNYYVQLGDTLMSIAKEIYNDENLYWIIYQANLIELKSVDSVKAGQVLFIPQIEPGR